MWPFNRYNVGQNLSSLKKRTKETKKPTNREPIIFCDTEYFPFEKQTSPVKFEPRSFAIPGVFVTSRTKKPETQKKWVSYELNLNLPFLISTILRLNLLTGKKSCTNLQYLCYRKGNDTCKKVLRVNLNFSIVWFFFICNSSNSIF